MADTVTILATSTHSGGTQTLKSEKVKGDAYFGTTDGLHTVMIDLAGFLGTIKQNSSGALESANLVVNLRCMQLIGKKSLLYAGGGITNQSTAEMEWEETEAKIQTLKSIF